MEIDGKFIKFIELKTNEEPLYLYEIYQNNPTDNNHEVPITREFFTQEEGVRNYQSLDFLNGKCRYLTQYYNIQGECIENYVKELSMLEFFEKILPYIEDDKKKQKKATEVLTSMINKAKNNNIDNNRITNTNKENNYNSIEKVLKKHIKIES